MSKPRTGPALPADRLHLLPRHREMLLALLREHLPGIEVWAYGSRVNGQSHDGSDLDLVLRSPDLQKIPIGQVADFREALRESNIPFLVEARDWARLPQGFHPEIEREYLVLVEPPERPDRNRWLETTLGEVVTLKRGYDLPQRERAHGSVPVVSSSGIIDYHSESKVSGPGVVTGRYGTLGQVFFIPGDFWPHNTALYVQDFKGNDPRFINYLLQSLDFSAYSDKTAVPGLNRNHLHEGLVRIPASIDEQRAIAHILGTLDDKIELNRRMNETLESMARALFKSWFVDFDPVHAKATLKRHAANPVPRQGNSTQATKGAPSDHSLLEGKPVGGTQTPLPLPKGGDWTAERARAYLDRMDPEIAALFPDRFVASELGPIPAGWDIRPLGECMDVTRGLSYKGSKLAATGLPMHNLNSIYEGGGYKQAGIKYYVGDFKARHTTHPGDLLVANTEQGHDRLLVGYAAVVPSRSGATSLFSHHLYRLRTSANLTPDYLCHLLNTQKMHDRVSAYATGTTVNMLPLDALQLPRIVVPCGPLVTVFDRVAKATRERQEQIIEEVHTLTALRDTLLPKLISGEIRAPDAMEIKNAAGLPEGSP